LKSLFLDVLAGKNPATPPPLWMMRQAGRYLPEYRQTRAKAGSFLGLCGNPALAAEVTLQPIHRFDLDAAIIFSDILTVVMALGHPVTFAEGPQLVPLDPRTEAVAALERDPVRWHAVLAPVYEALALTRASLAEDKALIGFAGAPWTLATYMAGGGNDDQRAARLWAYRDPDGFRALIDLLVDCVSQHLIWQLEAGAQAVQIFDSWAGGLPTDQVFQWVYEPAAKIVEKVRAAVPQAPIIWFPRGMIESALQLFGRRFKPDAISLDTAADINWAVQELGFDGVLQGNLDPLALLVGGATLANGVKAILAATRNTPFIFNLGHGILKETPIEHVHELVRLVRSGSRPVRSLP
jgi:uroporphyrinogen decarboxylase